MTAPRAAYSLRIGPGPLLAAAVHDGHDLRPEIEDRIALDDATRLREEDPGTGAWTRIAPNRIVAHRSRFEVDFNRPRDGAVYLTPEAAWGLTVWSEPLPAPVLERSLDIYDRFYADLGLVLARLVSDFGGALVYDVHSFNHRRDGSDAEEAAREENPDVNLGTRWMDVERWGPVAEAFLEVAGRSRVGDRTLDARENVRFQGGHLGAWISRRYPERACVLSIEVKKIFMDEWTGELDETRSAEIVAMLSATIPVTLAAFRGRLASRATV